MRLYDAYISVTLTPNVLTQLDALGEPLNGRNAAVRSLILEDLGEVVFEGKGLADIRLRPYRRKPGKRLRGHAKRVFRVQRDLRVFSEARCAALGFSMAEYITALIVRGTEKQQGGKVA